MEATQLRKEFEEKGFVSWINSDTFPCGKIYTKEYTEFLETKLLKIKYNGRNISRLQSLCKMD